MTLDILKSWNPHVHGTLAILRNQYAPVANVEREGISPEEAKIRADARDRLRADYHKKFYQQFMKASDLEAFLAVQAQSNGYDIETIVAQEVAEARRLRDLAPYGEINTASGAVFSETSQIRSYIHDFSRLMGRLAPDDRRHSEVVVMHERTKNAYNVCLVATRHNTVHRDAADMGREIWQLYERALFGKKPLNVFQYIPAEESAIAGSPDRLIHVMEDGKKHCSTVIFNTIPRRIDQLWAMHAPYLDYQDIGNLRFEQAPSARTSSFRAYRDFTLGLGI